MASIKSLYPNPFDLVNPGIEQILIGIKSFTSALRHSLGAAKELVSVDKVALDYTL